MIDDVVWIVAGYLFGSLSTAVIVSRLMGLADPRGYGSKNPGATNVLRHGGKKAAALTLLGDSVKGVIPVLLAKAFGLAAPGLALVGLAAFLGHLYPVFFGFRGGKGVATAAGVLLALAWPVGLAVLVTWIVVALVGNISSLAALVAAVLAPLYMQVINGTPAYVVMTVVLSALLIWRHRSNIRNLLAGTEGKIRGD